jgi:hypothetical protein
MGAQSVNNLEGDGKIREKQDADKILGQEMK